MEKFKKKFFKIDFYKICKDNFSKVFLEDSLTNETITYGDTCDNVNKICYLLRKNKYRKKNVISFIENSSINLQFFFSLMLNGNNYAPLPPESSVSEFNDFYSFYNKPLVLISNATNNSLILFFKKKKIKVLNLSKINLKKIKKKILNKNFLSGNLIINSSGTTGDPKKVLINIDNLWTNANLFSNYYSFLNKESVFINILPMSYLGGLFNLGLIPFSVGGKIVIIKEFTGYTFLNFWNLVFRYKVNILWIVPSILKGLLKLSKNFENYKKIYKPNFPLTCLLGTASINLALKKKFEKKFSLKVYENYGTSETCFISAENEKNINSRSLYSVGKILPWIKIKKNKNKKFNLTVKNPFQFIGYLKDNFKIEKYDYFPTGDICSFSKNRTLKILDRERRIVKKGGLLIPLKLIEDYMESIFGIEEASAKKIKHKFYGESFDIYYKLFKSNTISLNKIEQKYKEKFSKNYWPSNFFPVKKFDKTISGKIKL